jgi:uncharacterized protein YjbJ (UPF0337 family)
MNWEQIEGNWHQFKGQVRQKWAKLTDDDLEAIGGKKDRLFGVLKQRYGLEKERASAEIDRWLQSLKHQQPSKP